MDKDMREMCESEEYKKLSDREQDNCLRSMMKNQSKSRKRNVMYNESKKRGILDRVEFIHDGGACVIDGKYYYYSQKKKGRVKGSKKYYQMRGFNHFLDTFIK